MQFTLGLESAIQVERITTLLTPHGIIRTGNTAQIFIGCTNQRILYRPNGINRRRGSRWVLRNQFERSTRFVLKYTSTRRILRVIADEILHGIIGRCRITVLIDHNGQQETVTRFQIDDQTTFRRREAHAIHFYTCKQY